MSLKDKKKLFVSGIKVDGTKTYSVNLDDVDDAVEELKQKIIEQHKICSDPQACTCEFIEELIDKVFE